MQIELTQGQKIELASTAFESIKKQFAAANIGETPVMGDPGFGNLSIWIQLIEDLIPIILKYIPQVENK